MLDIRLNNEFESSKWFNRALSMTGLVACLSLLAYKFFLTGRLNINWDEFSYLNYVYAMARGELYWLQQGVYTHLLLWIPMLPGDEIAQIVAGRTVMVVMLCGTTVLVWLLGLRWLCGFPAVVAPFVYLAFVPVMVHGGSFRPDTMLALLTLAALGLLAPGLRVRYDWYAGVLLGVAFAVTEKVVLFSPLVAVFLLFRGSTMSPMGGIDWVVAARSLLRVAVATGITAALLIYFHSLSLLLVPTGSVAGTVLDSGIQAAEKTLVDIPWFARLKYLQRYVDLQPLPWLLIGLGTLAALVRRRFDLASLSMALLPIAVYRNAFPYYYVVMLAPVSILAGFAVQEMRDFLAARGKGAFAFALVCAVWLGLLYQGFAGTGKFREDGQVYQRMLVSAVHYVFPKKVNYIDGCGMISSFRKVNSYMSTWGMEDYWAGNRPFMPGLIRNEKPAFVLSNSWDLIPGQTISRGLLPEDEDLISKYYPKYWGPLRVAGASEKFGRTGKVNLLVPFPADYRIVTTVAVSVDGVPRESGDVIHVPVGGVSVRAIGVNDATADTSIKLFLAMAQPPEDMKLPSAPPFEAL